MSTQTGIFALGTTDHVYLELDLPDPQGAADVIARIVGLVRELSTTSGVNVVLGVRPSLWARIADHDDVPLDVHDWTDDVVGPDGFTMPATPHDLWLWIAAGSRTATFDATVLARQRLGTAVGVATETLGWLYRHDRDLTGFIDGTENPSLLEAPALVGRPAGQPGAGSSVLLFQLWRHDTAAWTALSTAEQELAMGRTKADSIELSDADKPATAHVARTVVEVDGAELDIFRRNVAYGDPSEHGTVFVGFSFDQWRMAEMLRRMAGVGDGVRDSLTRYTTPLTGAYYVVPSVDALAGFAPDDD